jgi:hypothetical protein
MLVRGNTASGTDRPGNNLLRRLNASDFALLAPHLAHQEAQPNELLYNPGDDVQVVYFPCGPSLVSFLVPNEDGRDVETILVGREGAVGGIVSLGYLPAYTRIMVKFGGAFVRLHVGKLDAAKATSASLCNVFARYADCMLAMRSIRSSSAPRNGSFRRWSAPMATTSCRSPMSSWRPCSGSAAAMPAA